MIVLAPISVGELIDKITILKIKSNLIKDTDKLFNIEKELQSLEELKDELNLDLDIVDSLQYKLYGVNLELWHIENYKRECEKNQSFDKINHLINEGHKDFGENKVQEAKLKWEVFLSKNQDINLHFIGKLQSNKIKGIGELFKFIHSLDNIKNADLLAKILYSG